MKKRTGVKVFAPATIGNVGVGFDILGLALSKPGDDIIARFGNTPGLKITSIKGDNGRLPRDIMKNTASYAAFKLLEHLGRTDECIEMEIHKKMPFGSGLGSSAASAAGGVFAVNELLNRPLTKPELLRFAVAGEELASGSLHADNVAPSLLGGVILMRSNEDLDFVRIPVPAGIMAVMIYPHIEILTKDSRGLLSEEVPFKDMITQSANLAGLIMGLYNSDFELIRRSLNDVVVEKQRAVLIPHFYDTKEMALEKGALGFSISGAGPSMFALCNNTVIAEDIGKAAKQIFSSNNIETTIYLSEVNHEGATLY